MDSKIYVFWPVWIQINYRLDVPALNWLYRIATENSVGICYVIYSTEDIPDEFWDDFIFFQPV